MTYQEAIERVQKLLRLSKSSNANEAASAMAFAQRIIDQHKLDVASLNTDEPEEKIQDFRDSLLDDSTASWRIRLAVVVSRANGCKVYTLGARGISIIGRKSEADTVRYMYAWLAKESDRLVKLHNHGGYGKTWCNNFRLGIVDALEVMLKKEKEDFTTQATAAGQTSALVRVSDSAKAVDLWAKENLNLRPRAASYARYDPSAREQGREAGASIKLGGRPSLSAGAKGLKP